MSSGGNDNNNKNNNGAVIRDDEKYVKNNDDAVMNCSSAASLCTIKMIQDDIHKRLDELKSRNVIEKDVVQLTKELQQLFESEDKPLYRRYIGIEARHLATLVEEIDKENASRASAFFREGIEFVRRCVDLRRNNPQITRANSVKYALEWDDSLLLGWVDAIQFGSIIGDCLKYNTHVSDIAIVVGTLFGPKDDATRKQANVDTVRQYIKNSSVLRRVELTLHGQSPHDEDYVALFLSDIGQNQHIAEVDCSRCHSTIPSAAFCKLVSESNSITTLSICCGVEWQDFTNAMEGLAVPHPWRLAQSLVNLRLYIIDINLMHALNFLELGHFQLQKLTLDKTARERGDLSTLSQFLQQTTTLQHLEFANFELRTHDVDCIFDGLQHHYAKNLATYVTKLSFLVCTFVNDDAAQRFLEHFQTPAINLHHGARLRELHISFQYREIIGIRAGSFIASLLTMRVNNSESSVPLIHNVPPFPGA